MLRAQTEMTQAWIPRHNHHKLINKVNCQTTKEELP